MALELHREKLGQFNSIDAFRAVVEGMSDALGEKATAVALVAAGRLRGKKLAEELGLKGTTQSLEEATQQITQVLGAEGSRLCIIDKIVQVFHDVFLVPHLTPFLELQHFTVNRCK